MAEIREKAVQAVRWLGAAESRALAAKAVSGEADGTALIAQEEKIPTWRARDFSQVPVGTPYRWNGQVYKLWQQHDAAGNEGWNPEDAVSLWDICHTTDPARAKPYVPPQGARGLWQAGECWLWEGAVMRCLQDNTAYSPAELPSAWEAVQP